MSSRLAFVRGIEERDHLLLLVLHTQKPGRCACQVSTQHRCLPHLHARRTQTCHLPAIPLAHHRVGIPYARLTSCASADFKKSYVT